MSVNFNRRFIKESPAYFLSKISAGAVIAVLLLLLPRFCHAAINNRVFAIYSETYNGIKYDTLNPPDSYGGYMAVSDASNVSISADMTVGNSTECQKGLKITVSANHTGSMWSQFGCDGTTSPTEKTTNMSAYTGGTLDFWIKTTTDVTVGIKDTIGEQDIYLTDPSLMDGYWHHVSTPLASFTGLDLTKITRPMRFGPKTLGSPPNVARTFWVDNVLWVSSQTGTFNATPNNISNNVSVSSLTWSSLDPVFNSTYPWKASDQYIQLDLDYYQPNWGIEIYTDNCASDANPQCSTNTTTLDPAGLVDTSSTSIVLPMCWSIVNSTVTGYTQRQISQSSDNKLYSNGNPTYLWIKDRNTPNITGSGTTAFVDGESYITVWDNQGIQWKEGSFSAPNDSNNSPSTPSPNFIYIGAKFTNAYAQRTYKTNKLIVELFYE